MIYAMLRFLNVADQHRASRPAAHLVPHPVNVEPFVGGFFGVANHFANFRVENLRAAAGQRTQPGLAQRFKRCRDASFCDPRQMFDFDGGKRFQVQPGIELLQFAKHLKVVVPLERRMQSADDVQFRDAELQCLPRLRHHLRNRKLVCAGIAAPPVKRAEIAIEDAKVGVIDVPVEDVEGDVAVFAFAHPVGHHAERCQIMRRKQPPAIGFVNAPARFHLFQNVAQLRLLNQFVHRQITSTTTAAKNTTLIMPLTRNAAAFTLTGSPRRASRCS